MPEKAVLPDPNHAIAFLIFAVMSMVARPVRDQTAFHNIDSPGHTHRKRSWCREYYEFFSEKVPT
jgi:hypothetical protein